MKQLVLRWAALCCGAGLFLSAAGTAAAQSCKATADDQEAIVQTMRGMYAAMTADDRPKVASYFAPGFYMFDGGKRFEGSSILDEIEAYRAKGVKFVWAVSQPDVHVHCDEAWIAYVNDGSIQMSANAAPMPTKWLESAVLERRNGAWKLVFFQSTRVPNE